MKNKFVVMAVLSCLFTTTPVWAADAGFDPGQQAANIQANMDPGASINRAKDMMERERVAQQIEEDRARSKEQIETGKNDMDESQAPEATLTLKKIETGKSEVLQPEEITAITDGYLNRPVSIKDLYAMVNQINQLYTSKGYATCGALLQPQNVEDGVLKVTLIEGRNGQVQILGNKNTKDNYIKKYLSLQENKIPNVNTLNSEMMLFNAVHDAQLRIMLKPGAKVGTTDYVLQVYEPKLHNFTLFSDNAGNYYTGEIRGGFFYNCRSLSGERDALTLGSIFSEGSEAVSANYSRTVGRKGTRINIGYNTNAVKQVRDDEDYFTKGHASAINLGVTQPLVVNQKMRTEVSAEFNHQNTNSDFITSAGARSNTVDDYLNDFTLGFAMTNYGKSSVIYQKHSLLLGKVEHDAGINADSDSKTYFQYKANGYYQKLYQHGQTFSVRGDLQLANSNQPTQRSFFVGGMNTVRGYKESLLGSDGGLNLSFEYACYVDKVKRTQFFTFLDYAKIWGESRLSNGVDNQLYSLGFGFRSNITKNIYLNWTMARALKSSFGTPGIDDVNKYRMNFFVSGTF